MKKYIRILLMIICCCVFCFSAYKVGTYYYESYQSEKKFSKLESLIKEDEPNRVMSFAEKYEELLNQNKDMIGWIQIEDTKLDYPVMQTPQDEEYYLRRNFDKEYEFRGTPFINASANLKDRDDNIIIYAHNMDDGTMFGALRKYTSKSYFEEHKIIQFNTIYENGSYEIFAVFTTVDVIGHEKYLDYYTFLNAKDENEFNKQIALYRSVSLYDTGITPKYGDKLITLSTCEYSEEHGRLVVVARKVKD